MVKLYYSNERSLPWEHEQDSTRNFHFQICLLGLQWQIIYKLQKVRGFWFCCWSSLLFRFHSGMEKWRSWWWWDSTHWCGCFILSFSYFLCLHLPVPSQLWPWLMSFFNWTRREYATNRALHLFFFLFLHSALSDEVLVSQVFPFLHGNTYGESTLLIFW